MNWKTERDRHLWIIDFSLCTQLQFYPGFYKLSALLVQNNFTLSLILYLLWIVLCKERQFSSRFVLSSGDATLKIHKDILMFTVYFSHFDAVSNFPDCRTCAKWRLSWRDFKESNQKLLCSPTLTKRKRTFFFRLKIRHFTRPKNLTCVVPLSKKQTKIKKRKSAFQLWRPAFVQDVFYVNLPEEDGLSSYAADLSAFFMMDA